jgi:hypothetical protein
VAESASPLFHPVMPDTKTANFHHETPEPHWARIAGIGYLFIIVCGLFAEFGVRQALYVPGDAVKTFQNIANAEGLYRIGIASDLVMLLADVAVAWALYLYLASVDRSLSLLAALLRLVQASIIGASLVNMVSVLPLLEDPENAVSVVRLTAAHGEGYRIGLVFFGLACGVLAALIRKSGHVPKWIGILLALAAAGYLMDSFGPIVFASYPPSLSEVVLLPAFVGEIAFCVWLIAWGGRTGGKKGMP